MNVGKFLCRSTDLREGEYLELQPAPGQAQPGQELVATRFQGQARVWLNCCPHQGRALNWAPGKFLTDAEGRLVCAAHGAVFEPDEGRCLSGPCLKASLTTVAVTEERGEIRMLARTPD